MLIGYSECAENAGDKDCFSLNLLDFDLEKRRQYGNFENLYSLKQVDHFFAIKVEKDFIFISACALVQVISYMSYLVFESLVALVNGFYLYLQIQRKPFKLFHYYDFNMGFEYVAPLE